MAKLPEDSSPNKNADDTKPQKEKEDHDGDNKDVKDSLKNKNGKDTEPRKTNEDPVDDNNVVEDSEQNENEDDGLAARMGDLDLAADSVTADSVAEDIVRVLIPGMFEIAKLIGNIIKDPNLYQCLTQNGSSEMINIGEFKDNSLLKHGAFVIIQIASFENGKKSCFLERILEDGVVKALINKGIWPDLAEFQVVYD